MMAERDRGSLALSFVNDAYLMALVVCQERKVHGPGNAAQIEFYGRTNIDETRSSQQDRFEFGTCQLVHLR
jgi:hypothetical protein